MHVLNLLLLPQVIKCKPRVEVAPPRAHKVRIKQVECATLTRGTSMRLVYACIPLVLGHKGSGVVEGVSPGVSKFSPGKPVRIIDASSTKMQCLRPLRHLGAQGKNIKYIFFWLLYDSICYFIVLMSSLLFYNIFFFCKNKEKPLNDAVLCLNRLKCDVKTIIGFHNPLRVEPGSTCVVLGLGAMGLATVMGCKVAGAARIIAVDINPGKFDKAEVFWATEFVNPKDHSKPIQEVLVEMTGKGVDFFLFLSFQMVKFKAIGLQGRRFVWSLTSVVGIGWKSLESVPKLVGEYMNKKLKLDVFVTHTLTLDQINEALDLLNGGKSIQTIINM
uniref:Alcohol dehydrogenase 5-like n=1 Tax=Oncorhynchus mykiss TaxID=8022 RepID=A0A8K9XVU1_ONCMY